MCVGAAAFFKTMTTTYESTRCREPRKGQSQFSAPCDAVPRLFRRTKKNADFQAEEHTSAVSPCFTTIRSMKFCSY